MQATHKVITNTRALVSQSRLRETDSEHSKEPLAYCRLDIAQCHIQWLICK